MVLIALVQKLFFPAFILPTAYILLFQPDVHWSIVFLRSQVLFFKAILSTFAFISKSTCYSFLRDVF